MATITLQNSSLMEVTILSNTFIDNYMPEANGEFVKVYIYLLRSLSNAPVSFSLEQMADRLLCTERDILRALKTAINSAVSCCSLPTDRSRQFLLFPPPGKLLPQQNSRQFHQRQRQCQFPLLKLPQTKPLLSRSRN